MNFELYIENLGAIDKAQITINPLTILAGENGTGKSFVTKFLYSVLNVLMRDTYRVYLNDNIEQVLSAFKGLDSTLREKYPSLKKIKLFLDDLQNILNDEQFSYRSIFNNDIINNLEIVLNDYNEEVKEITDELQSSLSDNEVKNPKQIRQSHKQNEFINLWIFRSFLEDFISVISDVEYHQEKACKIYLSDEIKSNFQISKLNQIIKNGEKKLLFKIKNMIEIEIVENEIKINHDVKKNNILNIDRLVFFESPTYWRLSKDLLNNTERLKVFYLSSMINDERLTGIPKHFLDLRELVFADFKHGERPKFVEQCANDLQNYLNGKFKTDSHDLSFETNTGQTINKNLISFGMTNLGVIQAVLNKNIINKGSFIFIDEPESNLHPEWQAVLADILVKLAENGVFVVITTHSSDMLKALDVISQERNHDESFVSANYFEKNGQLTQFDDYDVQTIGKFNLISKKLLEPYAMMTFAKKGGFFDD
ncbi:AAA family ATPase [Moraxella equi]|uniref:Uncharacterized conserved protein n=1 Tax=Moraxella equi TaxID=60442 RepID=A0A378QSG5_9GAMM|nr:AAA family ATPase [Moraxella equi]OPH39698.1 hypothetical protein B5J93_02955 [Moraxella equi]STZ02333.1 Uncharacterized conserved protein [Moraxella equi]